MSHKTDRCALRYGRPAVAAQDAGATGAPPADPAVFCRPGAACQPADEHTAEAGCLAGLVSDHWMGVSSPGPVTQQMAAAYNPDLEPDAQRLTAHAAGRAYAPEPSEDVQETGPLAVLGIDSCAMENDEALWQWWMTPLPHRRQPGP